MKPKLERLRPACTYCGDEIFPGEYQDPVSGRCIHCGGRSGSAIGFLLLVLALGLFCIGVALFSWYLAASRPADHPQALVREAGERPVVDGPRTGAPRVEPAASAAVEKLQGPWTIPASGGAPSATGEVLAASLPGGSPTASPVPDAIRYTGTATWYCGNGSPCTRGYGPEDLVAAIDRKDTTFRKGDVVVVKYSCGDGCLRAVRVTIVDTCACADRRVIDLTTGAFRRLAPLGMGVLPVTVEFAGGPEITLPPTDEED